MLEKFEKRYISPNFNQPAPNPYAMRQYQRMANRWAKWVHISKRPLFKYDRLGVPVFSSFTPGITLIKKA